jgi:pimeloyl-ACP methyl ester carboxylesterase
MSLFVSETSVPGAPAIVFLHGVATSGWMWWKQIAALADFHCLNVDLPGHGKSNHVPWISLADTADKIATLIRARTPSGQAHVVGLSLGGHVALALLERHADVLDRVVISGVTSAPMPNRVWLKPQLALMTYLMKRRWFGDMQAKSRNLPPDAHAALIENLLAMSTDAYRRIYEEAVDYRVPASLRFVENPTLITAGSRESKIIIEAIAAITSIMPNAQGYLAPGLSHGWNVEAPDLFSEMIRAWINGRPLPQGLQKIC